MIASSGDTGEFECPISREQEQGIFPTNLHGPTQWSIAATF
jgi:hypothetical protein